MILPRHRIDELRAHHDALLGLPMTPPGMVEFAQLVTSAIALSRPLTVAEIEPGRVLVEAAKADLRRALELIQGATRALGSAGEGTTRDSAQRGLARLGDRVDVVAGYELHQPFAFGLSTIGEWVAYLNQELVRGRGVMAAALAGIAQLTDLRYFVPNEFGKSRAGAVLGILDCIAAYEHFDRTAVDAVTMLDERAADAMFQGDYDRLDPLSVLVR